MFINTTTKNVVRIGKHSELLKITNDPLVFHQKRERIIAHFMICYTALLIYRLFEKKLDVYGTHFTVGNVIKTLNSMDVANIEDICYMSTYTGSAVCTSLNAVTSLGLDKKILSAKRTQ